MQMNVGIKGVIPGEATEQHLKHSILKCKFWGGLALGTLAVLAHLFDMMCQVRKGLFLSQGILSHWQCDCRAARATIAEPVPNS